MNAAFREAGTLLTTAVSTTKQSEHKPETIAEIQLIQPEIPPPPGLGFISLFALRSFLFPAGPNSGKFRKFNPRAFFPNSTQRNMKTRSTLLAAGDNELRARPNHRVEFRKFNPRCFPSQQSTMFEKQRSE